MCLIVHSPKGELMDRAVFDYARSVNGDGIGIMSEFGVAKFLGKKSGKKAWRELVFLSSQKVAWALHFRWATHGDIIKSLCHPFHAPDSDAYIMHNGVLSQTTKDATKYASDTLLYVTRYMRGCPGPDSARHEKYYDAIEDHIGWGNKFCIYHSQSKKFTIVNADAGEWIDGFWYSNTYSLPAYMVPLDEAAGRFNYATTGVEHYYAGNALGSTYIAQHPEPCKYKEGKLCSCDITTLYPYKSSLKGHHSSCDTFTYVVDGRGSVERKACSCGFEAGMAALQEADIKSGITLEHTLPLEPKLLGYYDGIEANDEDGYYDEGTQVGERAAIDSNPPTAEDIAWLRNQQLASAVGDATSWAKPKHSPLDKWMNDDEYREELKRKAAAVV